MSKKISIIGCGNMGSAIAVQLLDNSIFAKEDVHIYDKNTDKMQYLQEIGLRAAENEEGAAKLSDIIILAVKPDDINSVLGKIATESKNKIIISIIAGVEIKKIRKRLNENCMIVRAMPNINITANAGLVALYSDNISEKGVDVVEKIFSGFAKTMWVEKEEDIDILTSISASGPAYLFRYAKEQVEFAKKLGIDERIAKKAVYQTMYGSGKMLIESSEILVDELIDKVASKGGTTEAGLREARKLKIWEGLRKVWNVAYKKAKR